MSVLLGVITLVGAMPAFAQQDAAKKLLAEVSKKYDSYQTIQANFSFSVVQAANKGRYSDTGILYLDKKNNKYQITMNSQDLISDSKNLHTILKDEKEVQIAEIEKNTDAIDPSNIFSFYKTGFKYTLVGNEKAGTTVLNVVQLTPTDTKKNYTKIKLRINKSTRCSFWFKLRELFFHANSQQHEFLNITESQNCLGWKRPPKSPSPPLNHITKLYI